ncbi:hypothetical protein [Pseudomonas sp. URMO17WK12:I4]|uniref:hypothetical protein n=1 Tax=Pseudomonas sp. URMO17WK12:I4 TaxID=1283292 RepID=UPI0012DEB7BF|nr:hypothetical protein [Pseudomonas sp. URMO17WK12:I4]
MKIAKNIIILAVVAYLFVVASFYSYFAIVSDPFGAVTITDHYLVSGPVKRALTPVISDEELISLLRGKKSKFIELVAINSKNCLSDSWGRLSPEIVSITNDIGLLRVYGVNSPLWFPQPYSDSALARWSARNSNFQHEILSIERIADINRRNEAITSAAESDRLNRCKYQSIRFVREKIASSAGLVKGIEYFPEPPRISEGVMILPSLRNPTDNAPSREVVSDLVDVPRGFWMTQKKCAYRKVDENWFLFTCPD